MDWLLNFIQDSVSFLVPFIILLGILIFVHEMGHFLVAKFYKVKVETFSLGFGPKIFQFQRGDTNYCVSLIPLGGYVKMFGDDPSAEVPENERHGSFLHKPVGQRIAIVLAGPLVNFFFAMFIFFIIAIVGEEMISPIVGDVEEDSVAWTYGFRPGDAIQSINGEPIRTWNEVKTKVESFKNQELSFDVTRMNTQEPISLQASTSVIPNPNILSTEEEVGDIKGLSFVARQTQIGILSPGSIAAQAGMKSFDKIQSINQTPMKKWYEIVSFLENYDQSEPLEIKYIRPPKEENSEVNEEVLTAHIEVPPALLGELSPEMLGFEIPDLYVSKFTEDSPAQKAGLLYGDRIRSINGDTISNWAGLVEKVQSYDPQSDALDIEVMRDGEIQSIAVVPKLVEQPDNRGGRQSKYALGIFANVMSGPTDHVLIRTFNPFLAMKKGVEDTLYWTKITCLSFLRLLQARVSHRAIGGPILIGQIASQTFQMGLSYFLKIMAIISINLFILNMLPIPVLDGGHLLFFTIEALRGAPLSMRKMEIAQIIGLILILSLMALAIFNDISRIFES